MHTMVGRSAIPRTLLTALVLVLTDVGQAPAQTPTLSNITRELRAREALLRSAIVQVEEESKFYTNPVQENSYLWAFAGTKLYRREELTASIRVVTICDGDEERDYFFRGKEPAGGKQVEVREPRARSGYSPLYGAFEWEGEKWSDVLSSGSFRVVERKGTSALGSTVRVQGKNARGREMAIDFVPEKGFVACRVVVDAKPASDLVEWQRDIYSMDSVSKVGEVWLPKKATLSIDCLTNGRWESNLRISYTFRFEQINDVNADLFKLPQLLAGTGVTTSDEQRHYVIGQDGKRIPLDGEEKRGMLVQ